MPAGAEGLTLLRLVIYTARIKFQAAAFAPTCAAPALVAAAPTATQAEDLLKSLPAKELDAVWDRDAKLTGGCTRVPPMYRLSDATMCPCRV